MHGEQAVACVSFVDDTEKEQDQPYLIPIGERARAIAEAFEKRQISSQQALEELEQLVGEYRSAVVEREESNLSSEGFGVYWLLQREGVAQAHKIAQQAAGAFAQYPHWKQSDEQERHVRMALYKGLMEAGVDNLELVNQVLQVLERAAQ